MKKQINERITTTYPNGKPKEITYYEDWVGVIAKNFYDEEGYITKRTGKIPDGLVKMFNENKVLKQEGMYKNGKKEGLFKYYHENGKVRDETTYKEGLREGLSLGYYDNGKKEYEIDWKENLRDGICRWYYEDGVLKVEMSYSEGKREGECKFYYEDGELRNIKKYKNDKLVDLVKKYIVGFDKVKEPFNEKRYTGTLKSPGDSMRKVLEKMGDPEDRIYGRDGIDIWYWGVSLKDHEYFARYTVTFDIKGNVYKKETDVTYEK